MLDNPASLKEMVLEHIDSAWILKDRIIYIPEFCHAQKGYELLKDLIFISENHLDKLYEKEKHLEFTNKYSIYRIMYRLGFIRIYVYDFDGEVKIVMEHSKFYKPNEYQQRLLNRANQVDKTNPYFVKGHENDKN